MKQYLQQNVEVYVFECDSDVITLSEGTSNDNNYGDIDWS
jgi:hypothetical protein